MEEAEQAEGVLVERHALQQILDYYLLASVGRPAMAISRRRTGKKRELRKRREGKKKKNSMV